MASAKRGSVLMEFVVVFPIYLVLFAGLFMLGDMLVRPIWLSTADAVAAHDLGYKEDSEDVSQDDSWGAGWSGMCRCFFGINSRSMINRRQDAVAVTNFVHYADPDFKRPWSLIAGAKSVDVYRLNALTQGQLEGMHDFLSGVHGSSLTLIEDGGIVALMRGGAIGITSKPSRRGRVCNYYTYRRAEYGENELPGTYRAMSVARAGHSGRLVNAVADDNPAWAVMAREKFPSEANTENDDEWQPRDNDSPQLGAEGEYTRYKPFEALSH